MVEMPDSSTVSASPLFDEHKDWAATVARQVKRKLPPSFELADLQQVAMIEHWRRAELYDASRGVPYRAYAWIYIVNAIRMSVRRKEYREATHEELKISGEKLSDARPRPDEEMLTREEQQRLAGSTLYLQRLHLLMAIARLPAEDAELVRQVLSGVDSADWDRAKRRQLSCAVMKLKRQLAPRRPKSPRRTAA